MRIKRPVQSWALLLALLILCACELQTTTPTPIVLPEGTAPPDEGNPEGEAAGSNDEEFFGGINPLTGLAVENSDILNRRPVAVKITAYPRSNRPQWGLSLADIVYEYYHNNELTRFHAIFYGQDAEMAGPIRSARLPDSHLMDIYGSVFTFASADARILERLKSEQRNAHLIYMLSGLCPPRPVCRYNPNGPNYLMTDTAEVGDFAVRSGGNAQRQPLEGMSFGEERPSGGEDVERINLSYSYAAYLYWQYDAESGRYLRYQDARDAVGGRAETYQLLTDRLNGQAIAADNVVVLYVPHFYEVYVAPSGGAPAIEIVDMKLEGRGLAYAFRDGQAYEVEWVREDGKVLYFEFADGQAYPFKPGTTWFQVITEQSRVEREENNWHFEFFLETP